MGRWPITGKSFSGLHSTIACLLAYSLSLACAVPGYAEEPATLSFSLRGGSAETRTLGELRAMAAPSSSRVQEPYEGSVATFRALPLNQILDAVYGTAWREEEELLFTCSDGYQPSIPVQRLLKHPAWLAFDRIADGGEALETGFTILKTESGTSRRVELSPYYLVWENLDRPQVLQEGDYGWPYQLVGMDLIQTRQRFPKMAPDTSASAEVLEGFAAFRVYCTRCHAVNGEGGTIGPELNSPVNPFDYRDAEWLRQWIQDPASLVATARMPAFNSNLPDRAELIDEILIYLKAMSKNKLEPSAL